MRIYFADNDRADFELVQKIAKSLGCTECIRVGTCSNLRELIRQNKIPDFVIIDGYMSLVRDPVCLLELLRDENLADVLFINYSTQPGPPASLTGMKLRMTYLSRTLSVPDLEMALKKLLVK
jgi:hypothetical protein